MVVLRKLFVSFMLNMVGHDTHLFYGNLCSVASTHNHAQVQSRELDRTRSALMMSMSIMTSSTAKHLHFSRCVRAVLD